MRGAGVAIDDTKALRLRPAALAEWLAWQETLHVREIDLGLDRVRAVAERMGLLQPAYAVVSVAGTNGKGSSVAMLTACLRESGYRVGTYTSPHLLRYNERIRIDEACVEDAVLCEAFARIDAARDGIALTYFEFGTLAALDLFSRAALDVAVLEVGLGGRLDAVNLVDADVALVTAIDIDHVEWLGPDRESIAHEKAGIFRRDRVAVCADPIPPAAIAAAAEADGTTLLQIGRQFSFTPQGGIWTFTCGDEVIKDLPRPRLTGEFQLQNAAGVIMALLALEARLPVTPAALAAGLARVTVPGRFEIVPGPVEYVLDVAHNPHAATSLADNLRARAPAARLHAVVGMLKDKDCYGVLNQLVPLVDAWHVCGLPSTRAAPAQALVDALANLPVRGPVSAYPTVAEAVHAVAAAALPGERVLVFGSFLTVAAAMRALDVGER
ncbi:MAG: bifunctional tetrahydrofolate synthase/dihydrofolate synthase [Gammaproteobacteria bacterium]|nr:bifunctional tetrahydrofolate synthase/dihydrofolate synthase [Gammaproteobacteria bacterium]